MPRAEHAVRHPDADLETLPDVAHVGGAGDEQITRINSPQQPPCAGLHVRVQRRDLVPVNRCQRGGIPADVADGRDGHQESEGRHDAAPHRNDDAGNLQAFGQRVGMHRAGAAERHEGVRARVPALLRQVHAGGGGHVLDHQIADARRR